MFPGHRDARGCRYHQPDLTSLPPVTEMQRCRIVEYS